MSKDPGTDPGREALDIEVDDDGEAIPWWLGVFMILFLLLLAAGGVILLIEYLKIKG